MFTERCVNLSDNVSVMNKVRLRQNKRNWRKRPQFIVQSSDFHVQITFSAGVTVVDKCDPSSSSVVNRTQRKNASHTRWSSTVSCKQKPLAMWDLDFQSSAHNQKQELSHTKRDLNCHQSKVPFTIEGQITFSPYFPEGSEFCIKVRFTYVHQTQSAICIKKRSLELKSQRKTGIFSGVSRTRVLKKLRESGGALWKGAEVTGLTRTKPNPLSVV